MDDGIGGTTACVDGFGISASNTATDRSYVSAVSDLPLTADDAEPSKGHEPDIPIPRIERSTNTTHGSDFPHSTGKGAKMSPPYGPTHRTSIDDLDRTRGLGDHISSVDDVSENFDGADDGTLSGPDDFSDSDEFPDEPEPQAEFEDDLRQPLYEPENDQLNFSRQLKIGVFLANVGEIYDSEHLQINEVLMTFSKSRLDKWLSWLRKYTWTGQTLSLLLRFRVHYWENEQNGDWWESKYWSAYHREWQSTWNHNNMSLSALYALINVRLHRKPKDVIDQHWYDEWIELKLWRHGFYRFVDFALFRASYNDAEDWKAILPPLVELRIAEHSLGDREFERTLRNNFHHGDTAAQRYLEQDWYDGADWHDNLGWMI